MKPRRPGRRGRILGDAPPDGGHERAGASDELSRLARALRVGGAARHDALTVLWLEAAGSAAPFPIATLDEARAAGHVTMTEREPATVSHLVVEHRGLQHVLMLAGEILLGGKQDRVLKSDVLLPPASGPRLVDVYCVEARRWAGPTSGFTSRGSVAAPALRATVMAKSAQEKVWAEVDRYAHAASAPSATGSVQRVYDSPAVRKMSDEAEEALRPPKDGGVSGAAVFHGTRRIGLDVFDVPTLFTRQWPKLVRAYAIEATRGSESAGDAGAMRAETRDLVARLAKATGVFRGTAGVGHTFEFRDDPCRGSAAGRRRSRGSPRRRVIARERARRPPIAGGQKTRRCLGYTRAGR